MAIGFTGRGDCDESCLGEKKLKWTYRNDVAPL